MIPFSRRDQIAVEQLIPLFDREITADPEQHNPARRAARREDIAQARIYFSQRRAADEQRKDEELRAKLDSARISNLPQHTHRVTNPRIATIQLEAPAEAEAAPMQPRGQRDVIIKVRSKRRPLTTILNPNHTNTTNAPQIVSNPLSLPTNPVNGIAESNAVSVAGNDKVLGSRLRPQSKKERTSTISAAPVIRPHQIPPKQDTASPTSSRTMSAGSSTLKVTAPPVLSHAQGSGPQDGATMVPVTLINGLDQSKLSSRQIPQSQRDPHAKGTETDPRQGSDLQSHDQRPLCGLLRRKDFEVRRIRGKLLVNNKVEYVVRWKSLWIPAALIHKGNDAEQSCVKADGAKWYIKKTLGRREKDGVEQVKVRWENTREPLKMLNNAREAVRLFEAKQQTVKTDDSEHVRQRKVLSIRESNFPVGSVLPQNEEDYAASQRWVAETWPKIRPHGRLDLYPAIYRIFTELIDLKGGTARGQKSYRCLMKLPQLRPLRWNADYLASGKLFTCCKRRRASLFIQVTGILAAPQCARCLRKRVTPFVGCVRADPRIQRWLNGTCTNCGTQDNGDCDYHGISHGQLAQPKKTSTRHARTSHGGNEHNHNTTSHDQNGIDDSEDDSEGDDSDDSDEEGDDDDDDDDDDDEHDRVASSTLWRSSPPILAIDKRMTQYAEATRDLTTGPPWPSSTTLGSSSSDGIVSSPLSARHGKLPSVTKTRKLPARKACGLTGLPPAQPVARPSSSTNDVQKSSMPHQRGNATDVNDIRMEFSTSTIGSSSSTSDRRRHSRDDFDPLPIEQDLLELSAKYDNSKPRKHHDLTDGSVAKPSSADYPDRRRSKDLRTDEGLPQSVPSDTSISSTSAGSSSRKRAAPAPLLPERPSRLSFTSAGKSTNVLPDRSVTAVVPKSNNTQHYDRARAAAGKTFLKICTTTDIDRDEVHFGCRAGQPCRNHAGAAPTARNPHIVVYHNTLSRDRRASLEEAEYILSQANCFWARRFTVIWNKWCRDKGGMEHEKRSQVELFLSSFPESLVDAAKDCCPKEVIMID